MSQQEIPAIQYYNSPEMEALALPLSEAVRFGNMLFLSGQMGIHADSGELIKGGVSAETKLTMENMKDVLEKNNANFDSIVKITVFLTDMNEWADINKVYAEYFPNKFPARSAVEVSGLALGGKVEIECIAIVKE